SSCLSLQPYHFLLLHQLHLTTSTSFFFFNDPPTTEIYTLSLHDALPISSVPTRTRSVTLPCSSASRAWSVYCGSGQYTDQARERSEEHTSELQSRGHLVCRLLLEKKKKKKHVDVISKDIAGSTRYVVADS